MDEKNKLTKQDIDIILMLCKSICVLAWLVVFIIVYVQADILGAMVVHLITFFLGMRKWLKKDFSQIRYFPEGIMSILMVITWIVLTIHGFLTVPLFALLWMCLWGFLNWLEPIK